MTDATITVTKSDKVDYDGETIWTVAIEGIVIGSVRKDTTTTYRMSGNIRTGASVRKGWSWAMNRATIQSVNVNRYSRSSGVVLTSKVKAVAEMVKTYEIFAARV